MDYYLKQNQKIYVITQIAMLIALTIAAKAFFYFFPIIYGYSIEFYVVIYIYGLMSLKKSSSKIFFGLITPWILLMIPPKVANWSDLLLEYILVMYIFIPLGWFQNIVDKLTNKRYFQEFLFAVIIISMFLIKLLVHVWAGALFYTNNNWIASLVINCEIIGINLIFVLPISIFMYHIFKIKNETSK